MNPANNINDKMSNMEVIDLDSDNDQEKKLIVDPESLKKSKISCINFDCKSGQNMKIASTFACTYYGVNLKKKKRRFVCDECYEAPFVHQETMATALLEGRPIYECPFPDEAPNQISLSDSESDTEENKRKMINILSKFIVIQKKKKHIIIIII